MPQTLTCLHGSWKWSSNDGYSCKTCGTPLSAEDVPSREGIPQFSFGALNAKVKEVDDREKRWDKDMPAYKRLRKQGLQPKTIDGAAHLEAKATTRFEIESGRVLEGETKRIETAVEAFQEITGNSVYNPNVTPVNL